MRPERPGKLVILPVVLAFSVSPLRPSKFDGEKRGFTFDKYVALHVQGHVEHDDLQQYGVDPLTEELKILWFQSGITDKTFDAVRLTPTSPSSRPSLLCKRRT